MLQAKDTDTAGVPTHGQSTRRTFYHGRAGTIITRLLTSCFFFCENVIYTLFQLDTPGLIGTGRGLKM